MKLHEIRFSIDVQIHVLRHFYFVDDAYKNLLIENGGITMSEINEILSTPGSKFHPVFANTPLILWERILARKDSLLPEPGSWPDDRFDVIMHFNADEYPDGIGTDVLVKISDLPEEKACSVVRQGRGDYHINSLKGMEAINSWQLNLVLGKEEEVFVRTIFPGIYAPPFPDEHSQVKEAYDKSQQFWSSHALIVS
jgi:hypothetical protein